MTMHRTGTKKKTAKNQAGGETQVYIQVNTTCNQKCAFCNRPPGYAEKQVFPLRAVKKAILQTAKEKGAQRVIFTGGETLLYPHLGEAIRFAKQRGLMTEIQTNGVLLGEPMLGSLKSAGLDIINVALHSHKKTVSEKLRGVRFGFKEIIENIQRASAMGFTIHVIHVINSLNYKDLPGFIDFVHRTGLRIACLNLSLVVPEGWAWEHPWVIPRMKQVKPFLQTAMKKCVAYRIRFDVSEIVPLCIVEGFEEHAISTLFRVSQLRIVDNYLSGKRNLDFADPSAQYAAKAPQCKTCTMDALCAGFYPRLKELYGVSDFVPRTDDPRAVYKKLRPS